MTIKDIEYVVFDIETTGLSLQDGSRIIEIGAVKIKSEKILDEFHSFINPECLIPPEVTNIHHITNDMVQEAPKREEILPQFIDFTGGACLVAHNIKFDLDFLCYELSQIGRNLKTETPAIDTLKMSRKFLVRLTSHRLENVANYFGVKSKNAHRALFDAKATGSILNHFLDMAESIGIKHFEDFHKEFCVTKPTYRIEAASQGSLF